MPSSIHSYWTLGYFPSSPLFVPFAQTPNYFLFVFLYGYQPILYAYEVTSRVPTLGLVSLQEAKADSLKNSVTRAFLKRGIKIATTESEGSSAATQRPIAFTCTHRTTTISDSGSNQVMHGSTERVSPLQLQESDTSKQKPLLWEPQPRRSQHRPTDTERTI
jgi:hypothetical protein